MIAGVIAKLSCDKDVRSQAINAIESQPGLEVGELIDERMLPVTVEAKDNQETEEITRWIMSIEGIEFVDVVYVHFEENESETISPAATLHTRPLETETDN